MILNVERKRYLYRHFFVYKYHVKIFLYLFNFSDSIFSKVKFFASHLTAIFKKVLKLHYSSFSDRIYMYIGQLQMSCIPNQRIAFAI